MQQQSNGLFIVKEVLQYSKPNAKVERQVY